MIEISGISKGLQIRKGEEHNKVTASDYATDLPSILLTFTCIMYLNLKGQICGRMVCYNSAGMDIGLEYGKELKECAYVISHSACCNFLMGNHHEVCGAGTSWK